MIKILSTAVTRLSHSIIVVIGFMHGIALPAVSDPHSITVFRSWFASSVAAAASHFVFSSRFLWFRVLCCR
jgi:hypothetical protein